MRCDMTAEGMHRIPVSYRRYHGRAEEYRASPIRLGSGSCDMNMTTHGTIDGRTSAQQQARCRRRRASR